MTKSYNIPKTITEAQTKSGYSFVLFNTNITQSTFRTIPYSEIYRSRNSVMETPAEYLQKAAEDEKLRIAKR